MDDRYGLRALFSFGIEGSSLSSMNTVRGSLGAILKAVQELDRTSGSTAERIGRQMGDMGRTASRGTERVASSVEKASSASREASAGLKGLKAEFRALRAESRNIDFGDLTDESAFKGATAEVHRYVDALKQLESQVKSDSVAEREFAATLKSAQRAGSGKADIADQQRKAAIAADRLGKAQALQSIGQSALRTISEPMEAAKELQQQMGTIQKLADGISDRGIVQIQNSIMNFAADMGIVDTQVSSVLEDLAGAGKNFSDAVNAQTGKRFIDERMAETQQILKNKSALDVTTGAATQLNITLGSIYKESLTNYSGGIVELNARAGSAINELTDKLQDVRISAQDVIPTMTVVMNTIGDAKNFPIEQIAAFSAGISSLGTIEPEAAGSFFNRLGASISSNAAGFAKALDMSEDEFDKAINTDKLGVVLKIAETYKTLEGGELVKGSFLKSIGIDSAQDQKLIQGVSNNIKVFQDARGVASKGFTGEAGKELSVMSEFERVAQTSAFRANQFTQAMKALKDTLGLAIMEALGPLLDITIKVVRLVLALTQQFPGLTKVIGVGITLFGALAVAVGTATAVLFTYQQAAATASIASMSMARGLIPLTGFYQTAMGAFTGTNPFVGAMTLVKQLVVPLAAPLGAVGTAIEGIGVSLTAALLSPLGLTIAGLTSLYLILEAATPGVSLLGTVLSGLAIPFGFILGFINGLAGGFLGKLKTAFSPLGDALSFPFHAMSEALKTAIATFTLFAGKGEELGKTVGEAIAFPFTWASAKIVGLWKGMLDKIGGFMKPFIEFMRFAGQLLVAALAQNSPGPTFMIALLWERSIGYITGLVTGFVDTTYWAGDKIKEAFSSVSGIFQNQDLKDQRDAALGYLDMMWRTVSPVKVLGDNLQELGKSFMAIPLVAGFFGLFTSEANLATSAIDGIKSAAKDSTTAISDVIALIRDAGSHTETTSASQVELWRRIVTTRDSITGFFRNIGSELQKNITFFTTLLLIISSMPLGLISKGFGFSILKFLPGSLIADDLRKKIPNAFISIAGALPLIVAYAISKGWFKGIEDGIASTHAWIKRTAIDIAIAFGGNPEYIEKFFDRMGQAVQELGNTFQSFFGFLRQVGIFQFLTSEIITQAVIAFLGLRKVAVLVPILGTVGGILDGLFGILLSIASFNFQILLAPIYLLGVLAASIAKTFSQLAVAPAVEQAVAAARTAGSVVGTETKVIFTAARASTTSFLDWVRLSLGKTKIGGKFLLPLLDGIIKFGKLSWVILGNFLDTLIETFPKDLIFGSLGGLLSGIGKIFVTIINAITDAFTFGITGILSFLPKAFEVAGKYFSTRGWLDLGIKAITPIDVLLAPFAKGAQNAIVAKIRALTGSMAVMGASMKDVIAGLTWLDRIRIFAPVVLQLVGALGLLIAALYIIGRSFGVLDSLVGAIDFAANAVKKFVSVAKSMSFVLHGLASDSYAFAIALRTLNEEGISTLAKGFGVEEWAVRSLGFLSRFGAVLHPIAVLIEGLDQGFKNLFNTITTYLGYAMLGLIAFFTIMSRGNLFQGVEKAFGFVGKAIGKLIGGIRGLIPAFNLLKMSMSEGSRKGEEFQIKLDEMRLSASKDSKSFFAKIAPYFKIPLVPEYDQKRVQEQLPRRQELQKFEKQIEQTAIASLQQRGIVKAKRGAFGIRSYSEAQIAESRQQIYQSPDALRAVAYQSGIKELQFLAEKNQVAALQSLKDESGRQKYLDTGKLIDRKMMIEAENVDITANRLNANVNKQNTPIVPFGRNTDRMFFGVGKAAAAYTADPTKLNVDPYQAGIAPGSTRTVAGAISEKGWDLSTLLSNAEKGGVKNIPLKQLKTDKGLLKYLKENYSITEAIKVIESQMITGVSVQDIEEILGVSIKGTSIEKNLEKIGTDQERLKYKAKKVDELISKIVMDQIALQGGGTLDPSSFTIEESFGFEEMRRKAKDGDPAMQKAMLQLNKAVSYSEQNLYAMRAGELEKVAEILQVDPSGKRDDVIEEILNTQVKLEQSFKNLGNKAKKAAPNPRTIQEMGLDLPSVQNTVSGRGRFGTKKEATRGIPAAELRESRAEALYAAGMDKAANPKQLAALRAEQAILEKAKDAMKFDAFVANTKNDLKQYAKDLGVGFGPNDDDKRIADRILRRLAPSLNIQSPNTNPEQFYANDIRSRAVQRTADKRLAQVAAEAVGGIEGVVAAAIKPIENEPPDLLKARRAQAVQAINTGKLEELSAKELYQLSRSLNISIVEMMQPGLKALTKEEKLRSNALRRTLISDRLREKGIKTQGDFIAQVQKNLETKSVAHLIVDDLQIEFGKLMKGGQIKDVRVLQEFAEVLNTVGRTGENAIVQLEAEIAAQTLLSREVKKNIPLMQRLFGSSEDKGIGKGFDLSRNNAVNALEQQSIQESQANKQLQMVRMRALEAMTFIATGSKEIPSLNTYRTMNIPSDALIQGKTANITTAEWDELAKKLNVSVDQLKNIEGFQVNPALKAQIEKTREDQAFRDAEASRRQKMTVEQRTAEDNSLQMAQIRRQQGIVSNLGIAVPDNLSREEAIAHQFQEMRQGLLANTNVQAEFIDRLIKGQVRSTTALSTAEKHYVSAIAKYAKITEQDVLALEKIPLTGRGKKIRAVVTAIPRAINKVRSVYGEYEKEKGFTLQGLMESSGFTNFADLTDTMKSEGLSQSQIKSFLAGPGTEREAYQKRKDNAEKVIFDELRKLGMNKKDANSKIATSSADELRRILIDQAKLSDAQAERFTREAKEAAPDLESMLGGSKNLGKIASMFGVEDAEEFKRRYTATEPGGFGFSGYLARKAGSRALDFGKEKAIQAGQGLLAGGKKVGRKGINLGGKAIREILAESLVRVGAKPLIESLATNAQEETHKLADRINRIRGYVPGAGMLEDSLRKVGGWFGTQSAQIVGRIDALPTFGERMEQFSNAVVEKYNSILEAVQKSADKVKSWVPTPLKNFLKGAWKLTFGALIGAGKAAVAATQVAIADRLPKKNTTTPPVTPTPGTPTGSTPERVLITPAPRVLVTPPPPPPGALAVTYSTAAKAFARQIGTIGEKMRLNYSDKAKAVPKIAVPRPQSFAPGHRQFQDEEITPVRAIALQKLAVLSKKVASRVAGAFQESAAKSELAYFQTSASIANRSWKGLVVRAYTTGKQILARIAENSPGTTAQIRDRYDQTSVAVAGNMHDMAQAAGTAGHQIEQSISHSATKSEGLLTHLAKGFGSVTKAGMAVGGAIAATGFAAQTVAFSLGNMGILDEETTQALSKFMEIFTLVGAIGGLAAPIIGAIGASLGAVVTIGGGAIAAIVGIGTAVSAFIISPFGIASIAAVGAILLINEGIKRYLGIDALGTILTPALDFTRSLFNQVSTEIIAAVSWVEGAWRGMVERFYPILQPIVQPALDIAQQLINALNHNPTERIPEAWFGAVERISEYLMHLPIIGSLVSGDLVKVFDPGRIFGGIFEGAANLISGLEKSGLGKLMGGQLQSLKNFFGGTKAPEKKEETVAPVILDYQNEFKNAIALAKAGGDQKAVEGLSAYKEATGGQITPEQYAGIFSTEGVGGDYLAKSVALSNAKAKESREFDALKTIGSLSSSGDEKLAATKGLRQDLFGTNLLMREPGDRRRALQMELTATNAELQKLTGGKSAINLFEFKKEDRDKIEKIADKAYRIAQEYQPNTLGGGARGFLDAIGIDPDGAQAAINGVSQSLGTLSNEWSDRWRYLERNGTGNIGEMISPGIEQARSGFAILGTGAKTFATEASGALMRLDFKALTASAASFGSTLGFGLGQIIEGFKSASLSAVVFGLFSLVALNPVALVVAGIGLAAIAIATNFLGVRTILVGVFKTIVGIVKTVAATISFVGRLATAIGTIFQGLRLGNLGMIQIGMKNVFESMDVYVNRIRVAFKDLVEGGFGLATGAIEGLGQVARNVLGFLGVSPEAVSGAFNRVAGSIAWVKQGLIALITRPQALWQKLKDLLDKIVQKVEGIMGRVSSTPGQVAGAVKSRFVNNPNTTQNPEVKPKKEGMMSRLGGMLGRKNEAVVMKADIPKAAAAPPPPPRSMPEAAAAIDAVEDSTNSAVSSARNALSSLSSALSTFSPSLAAPLIMFSSLMDAAFSFGETIPAVRSLGTAIAAQGGIVAAVNAMMATTYGALTAAATTAWTAITGPLLPFIAIAAVVVAIAAVVVATVVGIYLAFKSNFLGITGLVTGVIDGFKMFFELLGGGTWDAIAGIFIAIDTEFRAIVGAFFEIGGAIMKAFEPITSLFGVSGGGGGGISLGSAIAAAVNMILLPLRAVSTAIIFVIKGVSMLIQGLLKVSAIVVGILLSPIKLMANYFGFVWNTVRAIAGFITSVWATVFGGIAQILMNSIMLPFRAIWGAIQSGLNFLRGVPILGGMLGAVTAPSAPPTPTGYATGGYVSGAGSTTGDRIPAMLSNGEFVVNAQSTGRNLGFLEAINNGASASEALSLLPTTPRPLPSPPSRSAGTGDATGRGEEERPTIKFELSVGEIHLHGSPEESAREFINLIGPEMERMVLEAMRQRMEFIR